jgi:hypothetical protein
VAIEADDLAEPSTRDFRALTENDATRLDDLKQVSSYWPTEPPRGQIHILVWNAHKRKPSSWFFFLPISSEETQTILDKAIPDIKKEIDRYLGEDIQLPLWELEDWPVEIQEHVSSLKIPKISQTSHDPCLILHDLGETPLDPDREKRIEELFAPEPGTSYVQQLYLNLYSTNLF